jgi:hypothetical protein
MWTYDSEGGFQMANEAMPFDYALFDKLYAELGSQNQAFRRMRVNRSTGQRALERRERERASAKPRAVEVLPAQPPLPYQSDVPAVLDDIKSDLIEVAMWWRDRKMRQTQPRRARGETVRWTIHVDRRWRDRVMELSDAERSSITDVMDRIFRSAFEHTL